MITKARLKGFLSRPLGKDGVSKTDEFLEKFQKGVGGGGVISNPKICVADFGP